MVDKRIISFEDRPINLVHQWIDAELADARERLRNANPYILCVDITNGVTVQRIIEAMNDEIRALLMKFFPTGKIEDMNDILAMTFGNVPFKRVIPGDVFRGEDFTGAIFCGSPRDWTKDAGEDLVAQDFYNLMHEAAERLKLASIGYCFSHQGRMRKAGHVVSSRLEYRRGSHVASLTRGGLLFAERLGITPRNSGELYFDHGDNVVVNGQLCSRVMPVMEKNDGFIVLGDEAEALTGGVRRDVEIVMGALENPNIAIDLTTQAHPEVTLIKWLIKNIEEGGNFDVSELHFAVDRMKEMINFLAIRAEAVKSRHG